MVSEKQRSKSKSQTTSRRVDGRNGDAPPAMAAAADGAPAELVIAASASLGGHEVIHNHGNRQHEASDNSQHRHSNGSSRHEEYDDEDEEDDHDIDIVATMEYRNQHWRKSPFAVGLTQPTWQDENVDCAKLCHSCGSGSSYSYLYCTAWLCTHCCRASRVGNMAVLHQRNEEIVLRNGRRFVGPRLKWVVGPYFVVTICLTIPLFTGLSLFTALRAIPSAPLPAVVCWGVANFSLFFSLCMVSCSDPGILYRHDEQPVGESEQWQWNDQALTFRPSHARFDPECGVVVEGFDHTCPWTGTAIGRRNMPWFKVFLVSILATIVLDLGLLSAAKMK